MRRNLHVKAVGLIAALVLGLGGTLAMHGPAHAADPNSLGLDLSGLTNVTTTIDNTTGAVTGTLDTGLGDTTGNATGSLDSAAGAVTGTLDATLGTGGSTASTGGGTSAGATASTGPASTDASASAGATTSTGTTTAGVSGDVGATAGDSNITTGVLDGVTGVLGEGSTGTASDSLAGAVNDVASIPTGGASTVGSTTDQTADGVTNAVNPAVAPALASCVNLPPAGVSVDLGSSCGGGSGILDPITTALAPITSPIANACLTAAGVDAESGATCTGSGNGGNDDILGPVNGVLEQGTGTLNPVLGDLSLPPVDTSGAGDGVNQVVNPLDVCANVDPANVTEELGAGCGQTQAPCTALNLNCLFADATEPVIGPGGALDPVLDTCLGYDPAGFNLDIGSACAAATPPPTSCPPDCGGTTCPPNCGPPVCTLICGPIVPTCPPDCGGPTCEPNCATNPGDNSTGAVSGNLADEGSLVVYTPSTTNGASPLVINGSAVRPMAATAGTPSARLGPAPLSTGATPAFAPPSAGDGGLLERGWGDVTLPIDPTVLFVGLFVVACAIRRRQHAQSD